MGLRRRFARLASTASPLALAVCVALYAPDVLAAKVGVAAAVKNRVQGGSGGSLRPLSVGSDLNTNEQVRTGDDSTAQLLFLDQTNLNVGPNSVVTSRPIRLRPESRDWERRAQREQGRVSICIRRSAAGELPDQDSGRDRGRAWLDRRLVRGRRLHVDRQRQRAVRDHAAERPHRGARAGRGCCPGAGERHGPGPVHQGRSRSILGEQLRFVPLARLDVLQRPDPTGEQDVSY